MLMPSISSVAGQICVNPIDGLCAIIQDQFSMEIDHALYLFCGRKCDRIKAILKEPDGIVMIYKRLTARGSLQMAQGQIRSPEPDMA